MCVDYVLWMKRIGKLSYLAMEFSSLKCSSGLSFQCRKGKFITDINRFEVLQGRYFFIRGALIMESLKKTIFAEFHSCCLDTDQPYICLIVRGSFRDMSEK